ncbi:MAG: right-handed parallel beta-helix repeat-containing protein [Candidatus Thermoplasmatota archaeon]
MIHRFKIRRQIYTERSFIKRLQSFIIILAIFSLTIHSEGYEFEQSHFFDGDWIVLVNNTTVARNISLGTNANLSVYGVLKLYNCTFTLNSTFGKIIVAEDATLEITNSTIISLYPSEMILNGYAIIENCLIKNLEIQILSSNVSISNTTVMESANNGIVIKNSSPILKNNTITSNFKAGIYSESSQALIYENKIVNNSIGFVAQNSNDALLANNISKNREYGILLANNSELSIQNNTIFNNNNSGIFLNKSSALIKNNNIGNNCNWGIELLDSNAQIENNTLEFNQNGSVVRKWSLKIDVVNGNNEYVENVGIAISNVLGTKFWGGIVNGSIVLALPEYEIINNTTVQHSPYSIYCEKNGVFDTEVIVLNQSKNIKLKLLADVLIKNIFTPSTTLPNQNITIKADFYNPYRIKISARINISIDSVPLYDSTLLFTENSGIALNLPWYSTEGSHKIEVWIDQHNLVEELNETNNYEFRMIEVSEAVITPQPEQQYFQYVLLTLIVFLFAIAIFLMFGKKF